MGCGIRLFLSYFYCVFIGKEFDLYEKEFVGEMNFYIIWMV